MGVRPARAEGTEARAPWDDPVADPLHLPGLAPGLESKRRLVEADPGVGRLRVQGRRQGPMAHLQQDFGQSGDTGGRFEMPDVGFHRSQGTGLHGHSGVTGERGEGLGQADDLDRITEGGSGAVRLDVTQGARVDIGRPERLDDHLRLRLRIGHGVAVGATAVIDGRALDHSMNSIAVLECQRQWLEQHRSHALAGHESVAALAEGAAFALGREHFHHAEMRVFRRMQIEIHPARDRLSAFPATNGFTGEMDGGRRGRTSGIDRETRTVEVEEIGHPVRQ